VERPPMDNFALPSYEEVTPRRPYPWFAGTTVDELFLDGGGALGISYSEFMYVLDEGVARRARGEQGRRGGLKRCSGSSIGALVAFSIVMGVHPRAMNDEMRKLSEIGTSLEAGDVDLAEHQRDTPAANPTLRLPLSYATDALREGISFVIRVCTEGSGIPASELTMADAEAVLGIELVVAVTVDRGLGPHLGEDHVIALSSRVHTDMLVRDALHASMGIPGVIHPLHYHGRYLADGSFGRLHPARVIRDYTAPGDDRTGRTSAAVIIQSREHYISMCAKSERRVADLVVRMTKAEGVSSRQLSGAWHGKLKDALDRCGSEAADELLELGF
jgi:predicted acylesterase/phospholipase RssA